MLPSFSVFYFSANSSGCASMYSAAYCLSFPIRSLSASQGIEFLFRALEVQELHLDVFSVKIFFQSHDIGFHPDRIFARIVGFLPMLLTPP